MEELYISELPAMTIIYNIIMKNIIMKLKKIYKTT